MKEVIEELVPSKEVSKSCDAKVTKAVLPTEDPLLNESNSGDNDDNTISPSIDTSVKKEHHTEQEEESEDAMSDDDEEIGDGATIEGEIGDEKSGIRLPLNALSRVDSSLGLLTSKFTDLMKSSITGTIHLSEAAYSLGVSKRRIYDITNVLEGVGVIVKRNRNIIQWKGEKTNIVSNIDCTHSNCGAISNSNDTENKITTKKSDVNKLEAERLEKVRREIDDLYKEGSKLDIYLTMMKKLSQMKEHQYCTPNDILKAITNLKNNDIRQRNYYESLCLIAIRAPSGSTMEVPHPTEGYFDGSKKRYKLRICNETAKTPMLDIEISPNEYKSENATEKECNSLQIDTECNTKGNESPPGTESGSREARLSESTSSDIQDKAPLSKKRRAASVLDNKVVSVQATQTNNNILFDEMSLPSSLPGVPGSIPVVDPIDVYYMKSKYDRESEIYVSMSSARRIDPVAMMTDAIVQGSILNTPPSPLSKRRKNNSKVLDSYLPLLEHERGVSNFFMTL